MDKLEKYIVDKSKPENDLLAELNRETHLKVLMPRMLSGHIQGKLLTSIADMFKPLRILEIGTYTGYSAICFAIGMPEEGIIHTIEKNDELESFAKSYFKKAGFEKKIKLHIGDALDIIPKIDEKFDLISIDGDKRQYLDYYHKVFPKLKKGGYILADNVLWDGKVVQEIKQNDTYTKGIMAFNDYVREDKKVESFILPIRDGLFFIKKIED